MAGKLRKMFSKRNGNDKSPNESTSTLVSPGPAPSYATYDPELKGYMYNGSTTTVTTADTRSSYPALGFIPEHHPPQPQAVPAPVPMPYQPAPVPAAAPSRSANVGGFFSASAKTNGTTNTAGKPAGAGTAAAATATAAGAGAAAGAGESTTSAAEVRRCTKLLRHMFELRIAAWTMEGAHASDEPRRLEMVQRADQLFVDIQAMVDQWQRSPPPNWSESEYQEIEWIAETLADPTWRFGRGGGMQQHGANGNGAAASGGEGENNALPAWANMTWEGPGH